MEAVILAGGIGSRLREVVPDLPKPMAPLNGRPFLEYLLDYWIAEGVGRFVLSVGYKSYAIEQHFGNSYKGAKIDYAIETEPLGTGGGLLLAAGRVKENTFLLLNGDTYFEVSLSKLLDRHKEKRADITIGLLRVPENKRYGCVELDDDERIKSFRAKAANTADSLINAGVYLVALEALDGLACKPGSKISLENTLLPDMIQAGKRIYGYPCEGATFIDIGVPHDYKAAAKLLGQPNH